MGADLGQKGFRVLVVEENHVACAGLREMLRSTFEQGLVREVVCAHSAAEALMTIPSWMPDLMMLSSDLDGPYNALVEAVTNCPVLVLVRSEDPGNLSAACRRRGDGFLLEWDLTLDSLAAALRQLQRGEVPLPPVIARHMLDATRQQIGSPRGVRLTPRERQVLELLAQGMSNKQIARGLTMSPHAAKRHVANLLMKLDSDNRTMAVARAMREGLLAASEGLVAGSP